MLTTEETPGLEAVQCPLCANTREFVPVRSARADPYMEKMGVALRRSCWVVCGRCGLVMQHPRPNAAAQDRMYAGGEYHAISNEQVRERLRYMEEKFAPKIEQIVRQLPAPSASPRVLDIGCGIGEVVALLGRKSIRATGIQPDKAMVAAGQEHLSVDISTGYFEAGRFPDESFDLVFSNHVFEHLTDPFGVVQAIAKVLKPGGRCLTYVPTYSSNGSWGARGWMNGAHNWLFSHQTLFALFARAGLTSVEHGYNPLADEVWTVVERPRSGLQERTVADVIVGLPSCREVKRYHDFVLDARAAAWTPIRVAKRLVEVGEIGLSDPGELAAQFRRMAAYRWQELQLLLASRGANR